jgi:hypothetical protein
MTHCVLLRRWETAMTDDEILQLASDTSGAHYMDHSHVLRFARAVIDRVTSAEPVAWRISGRFGWTYQEEPPYESQRGRVAEPLYATPPAAPQGEADAYGYASRLAVAIWEKHYKDAAPQWKPLDDLMGVLTQIDNMSSGLSLAAPPAPSAERDVMREALEALGRGRPQIRGALVQQDQDAAITALRKALAAGALDRLAQANHELDFGENE